MRVSVFALTNAGIVVSDFEVSSIFQNSIFLGVGLGLVVGKPVGIILACFIAVKIRWASLPNQVSWQHLGGAALLSGIGFTMAIFITNLSLTGEHATIAKIAILCASMASAIAGYVLLKLSLLKA